MGRTLQEQIRDKINITEVYTQVSNQVNLWLWETSREKIGIPVYEQVNMQAREQIFIESIFE